MTFWPVGMPFAWSYAVLLVVQASLVAIPDAGLPQFAYKFAGKAWLLILPLSICVVITLLMILPAVADVLTWISLVAFPLLAAATLGWAMHGARPYFSLAVFPLLAAAISYMGERVGQISGVLLTSLSCITLARLLVGVVDKAGHTTPERYRRYGMMSVRAAIIVTAIADSCLVFSGELQAPNGVLNNATPSIPVPHPHPAPTPAPPGPPHNGTNGTNHSGPIAPWNNWTEFDLPRLQFLEIDKSFLGYEDVFIAGVFGALLASEGAPVKVQVAAAATTFLVSVVFSCLYVLVKILPCTVPVAVATVIFCFCPHKKEDSSVPLATDSFNVVSLQQADQGSVSGI